jgi:hypothetical protein
MNEIRYLKSHSFAVLIAEPTQIYKKRDFCSDDSMGKRIVLVLCNRLHITSSENQVQREG